MEKKLKSLLTSLIIMSLIIGLLIFNYVKFKTGPYFTYAKIDEKIFEQFKVDNNLSNLKPFGRMSLDTLVYSAKDNKLLYLFDSDGLLLDTLSLSEFEGAISEEYLEISSPIPTYFKDEIVLVYENQEILIVTDMNKELIYKYKKGFGLDEK